MARIDTDQTVIFGLLAEDRKVLPVPGIPTSVLLTVQSFVSCADSGARWEPCAVVIGPRGIRSELAPKPTPLASFDGKAVGF